MHRQGGEETDALFSLPKSMGVYGLRQPPSPAVALPIIHLREQDSYRKTEKVWRGEKGSRLCGEVNQCAAPTEKTRTSFFLKLLHVPSLCRAIGLHRRFIQRIVQIAHCLKLENDYGHLCGRVTGRVGMYERNHRCMSHSSGHCPAQIAREPSRIVASVCKVTGLADNPMPPRRRGVELSNAKRALAFVRHRTRVKPFWLAYPRHARARQPCGTQKE